MYLPKALSVPPNRRRWGANSGVDKIGFQVFFFFSFPLLSPQLDCFQRRSTLVDFKQEQCSSKSSAQARAALADPKDVPVLLRHQLW
jgi:hypothetical protein